MEPLVRILHLEDDQVDAELIQAKIREVDLPCQVTLVRDQDEYRRALQKNKFDIILADFKLPTYDGLSALRLAKELQPDVPLVFVSGTMGEEAAIEGLTQGATDYVLKHNLSRLAPAVQRAFREARNRSRRRQAERALVKTNEMLRAIIEAAPVAIIGMDLDGHVHSVWNPAAEKMLGWSAQEVMGRPFPTVPKEKQEEFEGIQEQIRKGRTLDGLEVRRQRRDGTPIDYSIYASALHDADGRISGNISVLVDITERKRADIRLNEQLYFLQQLIDSIPVPVYYKDLEGLYLSCNAAFETFTGLPRKDIVGKTVYQVASKKRADKHHEMDLALLRQPGVQTYEVNGRYKDGKHHDVIFNKATFVDANGRVAGTVGTLLDITELKRAQHERLANLKFFESMDTVNQAIHGADDLEEMMKDLLDVVLSTFDCDRAFLMYPCDPESPTWSCPMERSKPEYPGVWHSKLETQMDSQVAGTMRILLAADGPVSFGPGTPHALPEDMSQKFGFKCFMSMAIYPKAGRPWQFGIHQCASARVWTVQEKRLFEAIGRRLADGLSSLLSYRDSHKNEEFLNNVVEHIPDMIFVKDAQTLKFVRFNRAGEQLVGYSRKELLGKTDHDIFPREEADIFMAKDRVVLNTKALVNISEETIRNRYGEERVLNTKKLPILDESGNPRYLLGISQDITERKKAEASIRKLSLAIEQSPVSIVITDVSGKIEFVNAEFTKITGYSFAEALGQNPRILQSGETPVGEYRRLWKTISTGGVWQGQFQNRKKNGELFWEQATIAPLRDGDDIISHYVAVKEDITERKKLEDQLRQVQKMEAIGQLAGGIAHDFNNILSAITGYTELSQSILDPQSPVSGYLGQVMEAGSRAKELIHQILMFSRETDQELRPIRVSLPVKEALKLIRASIPASVEIRSKILSEASALADPTQLHQIVMNLCTNAAQAMREKGGLLEVMLTDITIEYPGDRKNYPDINPGNYIRLTVSDQGHGIDAHFIHRIFDPFFTTKKIGEGTGMGLSVVHGIVKSYGGSIYAHSQIGEGSTFEILIPAQELETSYDAILDQPIPTGNESILFVDDENMIVDIVEKMLKSLGYHVVARTSAIEALEAFQNNPDKFDLVVTDMAMPKMSGLDLTEKILQIRPGFPIVLCTGFDENMNEVKIARHGLSDIIHKPILRRDMAIAVRKTLDHR